MYFFIDYIDIDGRSSARVNNRNTVGEKSDFQPLLYAKISRKSNTATVIIRPISLDRQSYIVDLL